MGAVDRGASLEWLSQYRGEKEILYPPMSYLEVTGETRMVAGPSGKVKETSFVTTYWSESTSSSR